MEVHLALVTWKKKPVVGLRTALFSNLMARATPILDKPFVALCAGQNWTMSRRRIT